MFLLPTRRNAQRVFILLIAVAITSFQFTFPASTSRAARPDETIQSQYEPLPDYDIRWLGKRSAKSTNVERKKLSLAAMNARQDELTLRWNDELDLPHHLFSARAPLTHASNADAEVIAKEFARSNSSLFSISKTELDRARVSARSVDERAGLTRLALEQRVGGIRVFGSEMLFIIDRDGRVLSESGAFIPALEGRGLPATPEITAEAALHNAARACRAELRAPLSSREDLTPARSRVVFSSDEIDERTEASLVYYPVTRENVRLAYQVLLYGAPSPIDSYLVLIDAQTGGLLKREWLTLALDPPSARVFTKENPILSGEREVVMLVGDPTASPNGWVAEDRTRGNNVEVIVNTDLTGGNSVKMNDEGNFDFPLDLGPGQSPLNYSKASAANLFYWLNLAHDRFHAIGFNEESRNFQTDNFNRGGRGDDAVRAETLRGAALTQNSTSQPVRNNAFFQPTLEGSPPGLVMLMWETFVNGQPAQLDSSYDAGVIIHEYTHGVSTRLSGTDNSLGLRSTQGGGMGEGLSDFFAMSFLNADAPIDAAVATGSYVTGLARGVRTYPYSRNFEINPLTYGDIRFSTGSHAQGTVWCNTLWEMRQSFIERYGQQAGREAAERLVINGLKLFPLAPTMIDGRDAILLADRATNNGANQDLIWRAFARRGLGRSASTLFSTGVGYRINVLESYDVPASATAGSLIVNDKPPQVAVLGENLELVVADRDLAAAASVPVTIRNLTSGATASFSFQSTGPGLFASQFRVVPPGAEGGPIASIAAQSGDEIVISYANARNEAGAAETVEARLRAGRRVALYEHDFEQGEGGWTLTSAWHLTERRSASSSHSIYFAKRKGVNESKSFTKAGSTGIAFSPAVNFSGFLKPQLEFDYYFSGAQAGNSASPQGDVLFILARNFSFVPAGSPAGGEPPLALNYDLRPTNDELFRRATVNLSFLGNRHAYFNFTFTASVADIARKKLEGFYLDNVRVTAISTQ